MSCCPKWRTLNIFLGLVYEREKRGAGDGQMDVSALMQFVSVKRAASAKANLSIYLHSSVNLVTSSMTLP